MEIEQLWTSTSSEVHSSGSNIRCTPPGVCSLLASKYEYITLNAFCCPWSWNAFVCVCVVSKILRASVESGCFRNIEFTTLLGNVAVPDTPDTPSNCYHVSVTVVLRKVQHSDDICSVVDLLMDGVAGGCQRYRTTAMVGMSRNEDTGGSL